MCVRQNSKNEKLKMASSAVNEIGNSLESKAIEQRIFPLTSTYRHDYGSLSKRKCVEGRRFSFEFFIDLISWWQYSIFAIVFYETSLLCPRWNCSSSIDSSVKNKRMWRLFSSLFSEKTCIWNSATNNQFLSNRVSRQCWTNRKSYFKIKITWSSTL